MALQKLFQTALLLPLWFGFVCSADFTANECFNPSVDSQGSITITCPENFVISVDDAFFGANTWGECILTEDDCTEQTKIFQVCDGQMNCTRTFKTFTRTCGYSSMLVLGYSCIRALKDPTEPPSTTPLQSVPEQSFPNYSSRPRNPTSAPQQPRPKSSSKDNEELGLIIGCALASFITVVFLIIAIVMVIRRLLEKDEKSGRENSPRSTGHCGSFCIKMDCLPLPCLGNTETPRKNSHDLRMRKKSTAESSPQTDQSKLRVAPIGEESIADQGCALSRDQDSTSSSSSLHAYEIPSTQPHQRHEKKVPATIHLQTQHPLQDGSPQHDPSKIEGKGKRGKKKHTSSNDHDNKNTLPSSSNRNLVPLENEISSSMDTNPSELKNTPSPPGPKFDAIAVPNTQTLSSC